MRYLPLMAALFLIAAIPPPSEVIDHLLVKETTIHLEARENIIRGDEGETFTLDSEPVDKKFRKAKCDVTLEFRNSPDSEHEGNDAIVASGSSEFEVRDIESGRDVQEQGHITLEGNSVDLLLTLGEDEVLSGHLSADLTCTKALLELPPIH